MAQKPFVHWGQDKRFVYLSVKVSDCQKPVVTIESERVTFASGDLSGKEFAFDIDVYLPLIPAESSWKASEREVNFSLRKEFSDAWPRLTCAKTKQPWVRIDFDRYQDSSSLSSSDEEGKEASNPAAALSRRAQEEAEREMREAEEFWKFFKNPLNLYLVVFNIFQTVGFAYVFITLVYTVCKQGPQGKTQVYSAVRDQLITVQLASVLEIFHSLLRWVPAGFLTTTMQVFGRNLVLFFILLPHEELHNSETVFWLFTAWSVIEVFRYPYYLLNILDWEHWTITYLRYTLWIPFYPLGFVCEGMLILKVLPEIDSKNKFSISLPNRANFAFHFPTFLHAYLVLMMLGFYLLMTHMYGRRKAKIGPNPKRKPKGLMGIVPGANILASRKKLN